jgi:transcriptional regulator GlxA family with amidase domain
MLQQGRLPIEEIARETGFGDRERMRRSFLRTFGESPEPFATQRIRWQPSSFIRTKTGGTA